MANERKALIKEYGPLAGMRVLGSGSIVAMPTALGLLGDLGAEVINIERPGYGDSMRMLSPTSSKTGVSNGWMQEARNRMSMALELNCNIPEVKELFFELIKEVDVYMENMVWLDKLGIHDEELLEVNPKLVIVHISGFGRAEFGGEEGVIGRASFDMIGQAFSGFMHLNGQPAPHEPQITGPYTNDYVSAYMAAFGALAGYISAQKTGKGQVVDVSQFEAMARMLCDNFVSYTENGKVTTRSGNVNERFQPYGLFEDKNGEFVTIGAFGKNVYLRFMDAAGLDAEKYTFENAGNGVEAVMSAHGRALDREIREWAASKTAKEIEEILNAKKVPASKVNTAEDAYKSEHFQSRGDFIKYVDQTSGQEVEAFGIVPKFSATPGDVWRGAPTMGQDTETILKELLNYDDAKISSLREQGYIG
ncbi:CaiB/BaiF CoA transferase family protein [Eremococcus coleocola]|uniref:CaiB/BaiF CoA transferase family protein n=1 Tax=Eremococcus coleocola TaxID=88132 RepID=UPI0003F95B2D|nr:CoA transferase [Eremococcus coleocola]